MKVSTIVVAGWYVMGGAHVSAGGKYESLLPPALRAARRHTQAAGDVKLVELRWMDAGTDQPIPWPAISLDGSFPSEITLDASVPSGGISMEAVVEGSSVGSVMIKWTSYPEDLIYIENSAPYLMCGNVGTNVLPCQNLKPASYPNITIWSEPNAKGTKLYENIIRATMGTLVEPYFKWFSLLNETTVLQKEYFGREISLSEAPKVSFQIDFQAYKQPTWFPKSALFNLDNGSLIRLDKTAPFTMLGNTGTTSYNTYTPTLGEHTLTVTAYREVDGKGQSFNMTLDFVVVP